MNKLNLIWIIGLFLMVSVSAELYYKQGSNISLKIPCTNDGSKCSQTTSCNITVVKNIDGSYLVNNQPTIDIGNSEFEYNITFPNYGEHRLTVYCSDGSNNVTSVFPAKVTRSGIESTTAQGVIYIFSILIVLVLFVLLLIGAIKINGSDQRDNQGFIASINYMKHAKVLCGMLAYVFFWIFCFLAEEMAGYLNLGTVLTLFEILFFITSILLIPISMIASWMIIVLAIADYKVKRKMSRGTHSK